MHIYQQSGRRYVHKFKFKFNVFRIMPLHGLVFDSITHKKKHGQPIPLTPPPPPTHMHKHCRSRRTDEYKAPSTSHIFKDVTKKQKR